MAVPKLDAARCRERNLAAAAAGFNSTPVKLSIDPPDPPDGWTVQTATPALPRGEAALDRINKKVPGDPLSLKNLFLLYPEAASTRYIPSRYGFLARSTIKNTHRGLDSGVSFMNSHKTGGMSTDAEVPYGQSFAARTETLVDGQGGKTLRTLAAVYMESGVTPNGPNGPSTNDLFKAISNGTMPDVSMGYARGGTVVCDVCGSDMEEIDPETGLPLCMHVPGTTYGMDGDEIAAQEERGVPGGVATYTMENFAPSEVSAVYDGAIPGAGFRKAMRFARNPALAFSKTHLEQAQAAYAHVLNGHRFTDKLPPRPRPPRPPVQPTPAAPAAQPRSATPMGHKFSTQQLLQALAQSGGGDVDLDDLIRTAGGQPGTQAPPPVTPPFQAGYAPAPAQPPAQLPPATLPPAQYAPPYGQTPPAQQHSVNFSPPTSVLELQIQQLREQVANLSNQIQTERVQHAQERQQQFNTNVSLEAERWAESMVNQGKLTPAEQYNATAQFRLAAAEDANNPIRVQFRSADGVNREGTRLDAYKAAYDCRPASNRSKELVVGDPTRQGAANASAAALPSGYQPQGDVSPAQLAAEAVDRIAQRRAGGRANGAAGR